MKEAAFRRAYVALLYSMPVPSTARTAGH